jgi:DNA mismatch endonuclease (patch repair protein)
MMDRSAIMRSIRGKDTSPELVVRQTAHRLGFRFRLHRRDLPGRPDLAFPGRRKVIFVHGCWWHGHNCKRGSRPARDNAAYWTAKIKRNVERDAVNAAALRELGWDVLVVWECELKDGVGKAVTELLESAPDGLISGHQPDTKTNAPDRLIRGLA